MSRSRSSRIVLATVLAVPFLLLTLLVPPVGNFPLNDDWVYAKMVQRLADDGHLGFSKFSNAFAITQTVYAAPLVEIFGFSFTLLRLTTIFMAWITVCFTAFTARELGVSNRGALLAAVTVFVNPLFINLSYTFMTEIPFCAFATMSTYFYIKSLRAPTAKNLLLGTVFSIVAFYCRQFGALIPLAYLFASVWTFRLSTRAHWRSAILCIGVPWLLALVPILWLRVPSNEKLIVRVAGRVMPLLQFLYIPFPGLLYLGLFALPLSALIVMVRVDGVRRFAFFANKLPMGIALGVVLCFPFFLVFPPLPNLIRNLGVGPALFSTVSPPGTAGMTFAPFFLGQSMVGVALLIIGSAIIATNGIEVAMRLRAPAARQAQVRFLALCALLFFITPLLSMEGPYFDRYLVPILPLITLILAYAIGRIRRLWLLYPSVLLSAMLFTFSAIALQDYLAWNTARWQAIDKLRSEYRAADTEIDGGFEFNGMYTSEAFLAEAGRRMPRKQWWVVEDTYLVSPIKVPTVGDGDYTVIDQVPYYSWLGFDTRYIYILRKADQSAKPS